MSKIWLTADGSWGAGRVVFLDTATMTEEEKSIIWDGTDTDREDLFYKKLVELQKEEER